MRSSRRLASVSPRVVSYGANEGSSIEIDVVAGVSYGSADFQTSVDLAVGTPVPEFPPRAPGRVTLAIPGDENFQFFRFASPELSLGLTESDVKVVGRFRQEETTVVGFATLEVCGSVRILKLRGPGDFRGARGHQQMLLNSRV